MSQPNAAAARMLAPARAALLLLWLLAVHLAYYAAHKPLDATAAQGWRVSLELLSAGVQPSALASAAAALATVAALLLAALAVGGLPARRLLSDDCTPTETLALTAALGLGLLSVALLGLAAARLLTPWSIGGLFAAALLMGAAGAWRNRLMRRPSGRQSSQCFRHSGAGSTVAKAVGAGPAPRRASVIAPSPATAPPLLAPGAGPSPMARAALIAFLALGAATVALRSLAPPTGWDSLVYHLTGPKLWLQTGGMVSGLDLPHHYFPALMEHLFAAGLGLNGEQATQPLHAAAAALTAVLTGALAERYVGKGSGLLAAALLLSAPSLLSLAARAYVDWTLMLFATAALWTALRVRETPAARGYVLAGLLLGFAAGTKYTAAGAILGVLAILATSSGSRPQQARGVALTIGTAALVFLPWALRDLALTGNPIYPFVFGGWNWDAWRAAWFSRPGTGLITEPWRLPLVPWEVTALGAEGGLLYDGTVGPLFLTLLPLGLLTLARRPALRPIALFAAVGYVVWLVGVSASSLLLQVRLLYPVFPAVALLCAAGLLSLRDWALPGVRPQRIVAAVVALDLALVAAGEVGRVGAETALPVVAGAETRAAYLERRLGEHAAVVTLLDQTAGPDARVLFLWEPRTYLCPVRCGPDALLFNFRDALRRWGSPQSVAGAWRSQGYTHVLLHGAGLRYFAQPPAAEMEPDHIAALVALEACCLHRLSGPPVSDALRGEGARFTLYRLDVP